MKNKIILFFQIAALCGVTCAATDLEVGDKLGERPGYGAGEHYFNNLVFSQERPIKLLTKLVKGADTYELTLSSDRVFNITSTPTSVRKISIKFKCRHASEKYLVDIVYMPNEEIIIALTEPPYGYEFIKFRRVNNNHVPYLYAEINGVPGLDSTKPDKAKELGFAPDGSFFVKLSDNRLDSYSIPEKGDYVFRNKNEHDLGQIRRYDSGLPDPLKIE